MFTSLLLFPVCILSQNVGASCARYIVVVGYVRMRSDSKTPFNCLVFTVSHFELGGERVVEIGFLCLECLEVPP